MELLPHAAFGATNSNPVVATATRVIHFVVGCRTEVARFPATTPASEIKELFRCAAEAGPSDIFKLYNEDGHLLNLSADLPSNKPSCRYTLEVVAANAHTMFLDQVGVDLAALEQRVGHLEQQLIGECDILPSALQELKEQVDGFRNKLETTEHLSWLGFYKQLPDPLSTDECRRLRYRRPSDSVRKRVKERFLQIGETEISDRVRKWLRMPTFDSRPWEDEEVLLLLQQMFLDLDLCARFGIELPTLRLFLYEIYKNYNDVPFHNFRHGFCVAQMMYTIIWATNLPPKIGHLEVLILLVSCICHDLDHPGYNNIYQINAKTELALRYNDISPLENHHCSVAFRVLANDECNIFKRFSGETFRQVREGMIRCILATDMARHNEILTQFKEVTRNFDYNNKTHTNLLTMVLIKVADISNEARPMDVAEPWLDRLLQEFFKQSDAEKLEGLPVTPFMDREKITKPSSQCSFIGFVLLPLFEALGDLLVELQDLIVQPVRDALDYYRILNDATKGERLHRRSVVAELLDHPALARSSVEGPTSRHQHSLSNHSLKSGRRSISFRSTSRSTDEDVEYSYTANDDEADGTADNDQNLCDLLEDIESDDSATATEVDVSEKTLKFKISTESTISHTARRSHPGSRKGSRDKSHPPIALEHVQSTTPGILARCNGKSLPQQQLSRKTKAIAQNLEVISSVENTIDVVQVPTGNNNRSLFSRLRQFTDRFGLSVDVRATKPNPLVLPKSKSKRHDLITHCCSKSVDELDVKRASTLPKTNRRLHNKKVWTTGPVTSASDIAVNSLQDIPSTSTAPETGRALNI